ncbi:intein-containing Rv2578c family radical SAM protein [Actinoplanes sp. NBRC 101535]|uniref:intein-containing Rv2578c family radical SAM protein n=1 Tax=Actinoplanes sp. NBRC 101535 TaxID=3032196 RepID=UPI0024A3B726|nr:intein-containing Rv2578c family radical SAM protein [Actinoplanes sp. NBRC 101535]GLY03338.1 radical SAM protein [Actinoplanes sp. NBRC 101535]
MRWSHLSVSSGDGSLPAGAAPAAPPLPLALPGATVRTFDTPDFAGMTFYEVRAKSLINRVPGASRVPFEWTVNPYRGCSHACTYCLAGDTPILLADGSTRPLAQLRPGDAVMGTMGAGPHRRYVPTTVLDHWSTSKPAFRVTLADGTRLVASGDHRFLTDRGWRHVSPTETGRPALAVGDLMLGVGRFAEPPKESPDYQAGFLCGLVRGDAASDGSSHEGDAWIRADGYLGDISLTEALRWPGAPTTDWHRGFLAGAFGAVGRTDRLAVVFESGDRFYLARVTESLTRLGLIARSPVRARPGHRHGPVQEPSAGRVETERHLEAALRFRHLTGAAQARLDASGVGVRTDRRLAVADIEDLGLTLPLFDISTGTGDFIADGVVSHNCFARNTHTYLDLDAGHDFDTRVIVKVNAGDLIRRELAAPRWTGAPIAMGTNVDVYQRAEGRYRLMPEILAALRDHANPFSILTKGTLILRDLDLLRQAAEVTRVALSFSVGFLDEAIWRSVEPGTPSPRRRLDAVRRLTDAGFPVSVLMAPILPGLTDTDESIDATVAAIAAAGATSVTPLPLHLRPGAREWYASWLAREHPHLRPRYRELFGNGSYLPRTRQDEINARVRMAARRHGLHRPDAAAARRVAAREEAADVAFGFSFAAESTPVSGSVASTSAASTSAASGSAASTSAASASAAKPSSAAVPGRADAGGSVPAAGPGSASDPDLGPATASNHDPGTGLGSGSGSGSSSSSSSSESRLRRAAELRPAGQRHQAEHPDQLTLL